MDKLDLIGLVISTNEVFHYNLKEKLNLITQYLKKFFNTKDIFFYENIYPPKNISLTSYNKLFISGEFTKEKNFYYFPIKLSTKIYSILAIKKKYITNNDIKIINIITKIIAYYFSNEEIIQDFQKYKTTISMHSKNEDIIYTDKIFFHLLKLIPKIFVSSQKLKILKIFSAFLMYNNVSTVERGIFYLKKNNIFYPAFVFNKNELNFLNFAQAVENFPKISFKQTKAYQDFLNLPKVKKYSNNIKINFKNKYYYEIFGIKKLIGFLVTNKNIDLLKFALNLIGVALENTEYLKKLKQTSKELEITQSSIFQDEKKHEINYLISQIAHEIKNPLLAISGFANRIKKNNNNPEKILNFTQIIIEESKRLENLLEDFINFNKADFSHYTKIQIINIIKNVLTILKPQIEEANINIIFEYKNIKKIYGDQAQLKQLFLNLILNSIEAIKNNGKIFINLSQDQNNIFITIKDNGPGIKDDILPNIFNPFYTTKSKGTGLGLTICYKIVKNHFGKIKVKNLDKGTLFTIILPKKLGGVKHV